MFSISLPTKTIVGASREELGEALRVPRVRMALVAIGRVAARLGDQRCERSRAFLRHELVHVDPGRHLVHTVDVTDDVLEHGADVLGADEHRLCVAPATRRPTARARAPAHRVLELRAVRLHDVPRAAGPPDGPPSRTWFAKTTSAGRARATPRVRLDVRLALSAREVLKQPRVEPFIVVEHEHGQQAVRQLRHDDARAPRS